MNEMIDHFHAIYPLRDTVKSDLANIIQHGTVKKGEHVFAAGMISTHFYFVTEGLLRCYVIREDDRRVSTRSFTKEGDFFILPQNIANIPMPGAENLHALEDTSFCCMSYADLALILKRHHVLYRVFTLIACEYQVRQTDANTIIRAGTTTEKRNWLQKYHPELIKRVPLTYLNNFLCIDLQAIPGYEI